MSLPNLGRSRSTWSEMYTMSNSSMWLFVYLDVLSVNTYSSVLTITFAAVFFFQLPVTSTNLFHCAQCADDFDLCVRCFSNTVGNGKHDKTHVFVTRGKCCSTRNRFFYFILVSVFREYLPLCYFFDQMINIPRWSAINSPQNLFRQ